MKYRILQPAGRDDLTPVSCVSCAIPLIGTSIDVGGKEMPICYSCWYRATQSDGGRDEYVGGVLIIEVDDDDDSEDEYDEDSGDYDSDDEYDEDSEDYDSEDYYDDDSE